MTRQLVLLIALSMIALPAVADAQTVESQATTKLTFTETSVSAPVAPGAMVGWAWLGRRYSGYSKIIYTGGDITTDADNDGLVTRVWTASATVPWNGIWIVTDLATGEIMAGSRSTTAIPPSVALPPNVFLRDQEGKFSHLIVPAPFRAYLQLERPGVGAWYAWLEDSGSGDLDGSLNGRVLLNTKSFEPLASSPPAPDGVLPGDIFVGILWDPNSQTGPGFEESWFGDAVENHLGDTPGTATVSFANPYVHYAGESGGTLRIPVLREQTSDGTAAVDYASSPANPSPGVHFDDFAGTLTFAPGEVLKTIDVPIIDDTLYSGSSQFTVTLSSPVGAALGAVTNAQAEIGDTDEDAPSLSVSTPEPGRLEGNAGVQEIPVTVSLSSAAACAINVNWSWREDYGTPTTGTLLFSPGETQKTFTMSWLGNTTTEPDRELRFAASWQPVQGPSEDASGLFTIVDDDRPGVPQGLDARYESPGIAISWLSDPKATNYVLESASADTGWMPIYTGASTTFLHTSVQAGRAYVYRVRAVDADQVSSNWSAPELATTVVFTNEPLTPGTIIQSDHLAQLVTAVNAIRALAFLGPLSFTDPAAVGSPIRASHVAELRDALAAARSSIGLSAVSFTDPSLVPGATPFRAAHLTELRHACR